MGDEIVPVCKGAELVNGEVSIPKPTAEQIIEQLRPRNANKPSFKELCFNEDGTPKFNVQDSGSATGAGQAPPKDKNNRNASR